MTETKHLPICVTFDNCPYNVMQLCTNPEKPCKDRTTTTLEVTIEEEKNG